jgi:transcriptional regulator with XRE-family HTH domain
MAKADEQRAAIGRAFRRRRTMLYLSQEAVAERAGLHPNQIRRIELATHDVKVSTMLRAADGLGVPLWQLTREALDE